jgi:hypothetical protein
VSEKANARKITLDARIATAARILESAKLLDHRVHWPSYSGVAKEVRDQPYRAEWGYYESQSLFDFRLLDGSLFQFKDQPESHTDISFSFYESPLLVDDYATFLYSNYSLSFEEVGDIAREDYDQYLSSASLKQAITMIRYDHSPGLYEEGSHPASHLHIGHGSPIRLATERIMNPISFTLFVMRQVYTRSWEALIASPVVDEHVKHVRDGLPRIATEFFNSKDRWELYLV